MPVLSRTYEVVIAGSRYRATYAPAPDNRVGSVEKYQADGSLRPVWDLLSRKPVTNEAQCVLNCDPCPVQWDPRRH